MSQNKTIVPGVDYDSLGQPQIDSTAYGDMYSRSGSDDNRTYIPGMQERQAPQAVSPGAHSAVGAAADGSQDADASRQITMQNRVVVGVLFSVSRGLLGEVFPLYLGRNIVGYTPNCDVRLLENTVSSEHAIIYIRKDTDGGGYRVSITDYNSTYGTQVGGRDARYDTLDVKENDIITIGSHYRLLVKLFDTDKAHLQEEPEFAAMDAGETAAPAVEGGTAYSTGVSSDFYTPSAREGESARTVIY